LADLLDVFGIAHWASSPKLVLQIVALMVVWSRRFPANQSAISASAVAGATRTSAGGVPNKTSSGDATEVIVALPDSSDAQRAAALTKAATARRMSAELRERLKSGDADLVQILREAETDPVLGSMRVSDLLAALPAVGKATSHQLMTEVGIAPTRQVRNLTPRQRAALLKRFSSS
jgi:hypothetical protein